MKAAGELSDRFSQWHDWSEAWLGKRRRSRYRGAQDILRLAKCKACIAVQDDCPVSHKELSGGRGVNMLTAAP